MQEEEAETQEISKCHVSRGNWNFQDSLGLLRVTEAESNCCVVGADPDQGSCRQEILLPARLPARCAEKFRVAALMSHHRVRCVFWKHGCFSVIPHTRR